MVTHLTIILGLRRQIKDGVIRAVSAVVPWWLAKKIFWKSKKRNSGDDVFTNLSRRNSRSRIRQKDLLQNGKNINFEVENNN